MPTDIAQQELKNEKVEMSLKELILIIKEWLHFLVKKLWIIIGVAVIAAVLGFFYSKTIKPNYLATSIFVLQEENSNQGNNLAMFGLGGGDKAAGLFEGDNLKWLYSSRLMIQKTLFTTVKNESGKDVLLINWFLKLDKDASKIVKANPKFQSVIFINSDVDSSDNETKNSMIGFCVGIIKGKYLKVKDVDKTDGIIEVDITSENEYFAKVLNENLVDNVNEYYIQTKTSKITKQIKELTQQVSDYNSKMNTSLYSTAEAVEAVPYPNPNNQVPLVAPKRKGIDADLNTTIYLQLMKSLETSKMDLQKATPLIQVIDAPVLPLPTLNKSFIFYMLAFGFVGFLITTIWLLVRHAIKQTMAS